MSCAHTFPSQHVSPTPPHTAGSTFSHTPASLSSRPLLHAGPPTLLSGGHGTVPETPQTVQVPSSSMNSLGPQAGMREAKHAGSPLVPHARQMPFWHSVERPRVVRSHALPGQHVRPSPPHTATSISSQAPELFSTSPGLHGVVVRQPGRWSPPHSTHVPAASGASKGPHGGKGRTEQATSPRRPHSEQMLSRHCTDPNSCSRLACGRGGLGRQAEKSKSSGPGSGSRGGGGWPWPGGTATVGGRGGGRLGVREPVAGQHGWSGPPHGACCRSRAESAAGRST